MEEDLISKKELLEQYQISYGALYRWKRMGLIPEAWFLRRSAPTGLRPISAARRSARGSSRSCAKRSAFPLSSWRPSWPVSSRRQAPDGC